MENRLCKWNELKIPSAISGMAMKIVHSYLWKALKIWFLIIVNTTCFNKLWTLLSCLYMDPQVFKIFSLWPCLGQNKHPFGFALVQVACWFSFICREMEYDGIVLESWSRWAAYGILHDPEMRNKVTIGLYEATFRALFFLGSDFYWNLLKCVALYHTLLFSIVFNKTKWWVENWYLVYKILHF